MNALPNTFGAAREAAQQQQLAIRAQRMTRNIPTADKPVAPQVGRDGKVKSVEDARDVARQFESLFVQMMVSGLRETASITGEEKSLFGDGPGADQFTQWFDQNMAESVSKGMDLGVSEAVLADLRRWGKIRDEDAQDGAKPDLGVRQAKPSQAVLRRGLDRLQAMERGLHHAAMTSEQGSAAVGNTPRTNIGGIHATV